MKCLAIPSTDAPLQTTAMEDVQAEFRELRLLAWTLPIFAIAITIFRLGIRVRKRQLWWDDFWALMAAICLTIFVAAMELHFTDEGSYSYTTRIAIYYMLDQFFYAVNWCSKLSILLTTMRLCAPGPFRRWLFRAALSFAVAWLILFAQVFWVCERQPGWKDTPAPQCNLGRNVAIAQVITDVVTDAILVAVPLKLVWRVKLTRPQKIRIIAIFSSTSIATAVSLYHSYAILRFGGFQEARAAVIQDGVSLIVADLGVVVAFFMRISSVDDSNHSRAVELSHFRATQRTLNPVTVNVDTSTTVFTDYRLTQDMVKIPSPDIASTDSKPPFLDGKTGRGGPHDFDEV